jgi:hypothetical protein
MSFLDLVEKDAEYGFLRIFSVRTPPSLETEERAGTTSRTVCFSYVAHVDPNQDSSVRKELRERFREKRLSDPVGRKDDRPKGAA